MKLVRPLFPLWLAAILVAALSLTAFAQDQSGPSPVAQGAPAPTPQAAPGAAQQSSSAPASQTPPASAKQPTPPSAPQASTAAAPAANSAADNAANPSELTSDSKNDPKLVRRPPPLSPAAAAAAAAPSAGPKVEVPTGTHISMVLHNAVSTHSARPGDPVYFETIFPVMIDGKVAIPAGSYISGEVTDSKRAGRVKGRAELMIKLTTLILPNAYMVNLNASPSGAGTGGGETVDNEGKITGDSDKASDAGTIIKGTAIGAGVGGLATQSIKGAGIGAGAGAAAGLVAVLLTRGPDAELPRGSTVEAVLDRPIFLDADKDQFSSPGEASTLPGPPNREPVRQKVPF